MLFNKASASGRWYRNDVELLERVMEMIKQLEHLSCEEGLRERGEEKALRRPHCGLLILEGNI